MEVYQRYASNEFFNETLKFNQRDSRWSVHRLRLDITGICLGGGGSFESEIHRFKQFLFRPQISEGLTKGGFKCPQICKSIHLSPDHLNFGRNDTPVFKAFNLILNSFCGTTERFWYAILCQLK